MSVSQDNSRLTSVEEFKLLREEIRFEYMVTSSRVAWYVASQAILISSFVLAIRGENSSLKWFWEMIPWLGFFTSLLVLFPIGISMWQVYCYRQKILELRLIPVAKGYLTWLAASYAMLTPVSFGIAWACILLKLAMLG